MPKTDNPHSMRLYAAIAKHADENAAERIANAVPLSKAADINKRFLWAETVCEALNREFDGETVKKIRMDCACGPENGKAEKLKKLYLRSADLGEFARNATAQEQGFEIEYRDNSLFLIYPQCYCSCVKRVDKVLPAAWCYCTLGYTKRMFGSVLDKPVEVELLESVKSGGSRCVIRIFGF